MWTRLAMKPATQCDARGTCFDLSFAAGRSLRGKIQNLPLPVCGYLAGVCVNNLAITLALNNLLSTRVTLQDVFKLVNRNNDFKGDGVG